MSKLTLISPAKLNLCLDILGRDQSGMHEIHTIFQEILLSDIITLMPLPSGKKHQIILTGKEITPGLTGSTSHQTRPISIHQTRTVLKILEIFAYLCDKKGKKICPVRIEIEKNIPIASGLGGGSSNAASIIKGLNLIWQLNWPLKKLLKIAIKIGMDTAFFLYGGTALGTHFGEIITPITALNPNQFEILPKNQWARPLHSPPKNQKKTKTALAYQALALENCGKQEEKTAKLLNFLGPHKPGSTIPQSKIHLFHNDFTQLYAPLPPNIFLSGSGPSTFKILPSKN